MSKLALSVEKAAPRRVPSKPVPASAGDAADLRWLDLRIDAIETGVDAVIEIARNWTDLRNVSRLFPGVSAAEYVTSRLGTLGKAVVPVLLAESNWSNRQIAVVAGVAPETVNVVARQVASSSHVEPRPVLGADGKSYAPRVVQAVVIDTPPPPATQVPTSDHPVMTGSQEDAPIDPAAWTALLRVLDSIDALAECDAAYIAATVPNRRRAATAKRVRKLGTYLGSIAWSLEREEYTP